MRKESIFSADSLTVFVQSPYAIVCSSIICAHVQISQLWQLHHCLNTRKRCTGSHTIIWTHEKFTTLAVIPLVERTKTLHWQPYHYLDTRKYYTHCQPYHYLDTRKYCTHWQPYHYFETRKTALSGSHTIIWRDEKTTLTGNHTIVWTHEKLHSLAAILLFRHTKILHTHLPR